MLDYISQKNILNKIAHHLTDMDVPFNWVDILLQNNEKRVILLLVFLFDDLEFDTTISIESLEGADDWISLRCYAFDISTIEDPKAINQILRIVLELNFYIPETTFALFKRKHVYIKSDMPVNVSLKSLEFEFNGFELGLINFFNKLRTLGYKIDPTKGKLPIKRA
ncbi:MAG: hypothetical protein ACTSPY_18525 [Candidatus Helarchaeota archaeon]